MKCLLVYWIAGCIAVGGGYSLYTQQCPNNPIPVSELTLTVAIWPIGIVVAAVNPKSNTCSGHVE